MALMITDECTNCDACISECPNEAISEGEDYYVIDSFRCTECVGHFDEPQCIPVCAPDCILPNPEFRESPEQLQAKYAQLQA